MAREKKSLKDRKDSVKKIFNKVWFYATLATIGIFVIAGVYTAINDIIKDKKEYVLKSLVEYNKNTFGYDVNDEPYKDAFPVCSYQFTSEFTENKATIKALSESVEVVPYYDMLYIKIENYTGEMSLIDEVFNNENIAGWCIRNGMEYYYGAPGCKTTNSEDWIVTEIASDSVETLSQTLINFMSVGEYMLVGDMNYGTFFINSNLADHIASNSDNIDETEFYIIIAQIIDAGWYTAEASEFINSYHIIKSSY